MNRSDRELADAIDNRLQSFVENTRALPGIRSQVSRWVFLSQIIESIHRVKYISLIRGRPIGPQRKDPASELFDPYKASILQQREGNLEEAFWLVFLAVHFGKSRRGGWRLCRDVYGALGGPHWTWPRTSANPAEFRRWLRANVPLLKGADIARGFGNHRKYQSLDADTPGGTGAAVETYVEWISGFGTHEQLIREFEAEAQGNARRAFDLLYNSMATVASFGRMARFDYLSMLGKLELAEIEPGSTYLSGATGPYQGARLLFGEKETEACTREQLDSWIVELGAHIELGMQVLEDALCNWQKSPERFLRFRG